jgi:hypothetical protein
MSGASFIGLIEICLMSELRDWFERKLAREFVGELAGLFGGPIFSPIASRTLSSSATVRLPYNTAHFPPTTMNSAIAVK